MKAKPLLTALALLLPLPAAGFPALAAEPAHLVADLSPGLEPFDPSDNHPDFNGYVTVGGRVLFFGFLPEGYGFVSRIQCGLWTVDLASGAAERLAPVCSDVESSTGSRLRWLTAGALFRRRREPRLLLRLHRPPLAHRRHRRRELRAGHRHGRRRAERPPRPGRRRADPLLPGLRPHHRVRALAQRRHAPAGPARCATSRRASTPRTRPASPATARGSSSPPPPAPSGRPTAPARERCGWPRSSPIRPGGGCDKPLPHGGLIYVVTLSGLADVWVYDPRTARARKLHSFPSDFLGRAGATLEEVGGRLLIRQFAHTGEPQSLWEALGTRLVPLGPLFVFTALSRPQAVGGRIVFAASRTAAPHPVDARSRHEASASPGRLRRRLPGGRHRARAGRAARGAPLLPRPRRRARARAVVDGRHRRRHPAGEGSLPRLLRRRTAPAPPGPRQARPPRSAGFPLGLGRHAGGDRSPRRDRRSVLVLRRRRPRACPPGGSSSPASTPPPAANPS